MAGLWNPLWSPLWGVSEVETELDTSGSWDGSAPWNGSLPWGSDTPPLEPGDYELFATVQPSNDPPRVRLDVNKAGWARAYITRLDKDGRWRPVRRAEPLSLVSGQGLVFDYEAPFGQPLTYSATNATAPSVSSNSVTLDVDDAWLRHPGVPDLSIRLNDIDKSSFASRTRRATRGVFQPMGRSTAIVVSDGRRKAPETVVTVRTSTLEELSHLYDTLSSSSTLLLSIPPSWRWGIETEYVSIGDVDEMRPVDIGDVETRLVSLPYTVVDRPAGGLLSQWTYADVATEFGTYSEVTSTFETYADLLANARRV